MYTILGLLSKLKQAQKHKFVSSIKMGSATLDVEFTSTTSHSKRRSFAEHVFREYPVDNVYWTVNNAVRIHVEGLYYITQKLAQKTKVYLQEDIQRAQQAHKLTSYYKDPLTLVLRFCGETNEHTIREVQKYIETEYYVENITLKVDKTLHVKLYDDRPTPMQTQTVNGVTIPITKNGFL